MSNNSSNKRFEELCAGYVLQALDEEGVREFEAMLKEASEEQLQLYHNMRTSANQLSFTIEGSEPPADIKKKLLASLKTENDDFDEENKGVIVSEEKDLDDTAAENEGREFNWPVFTLAASVALLIICLSLIFYSFNLSSQLDRKEEEIAQQQEVISELQTDILQKNELLTVLESQEVEIISMSGMQSNPDGFGKIIWSSKSGNALIQVANMPVTKEDNVYQLWIISNNKYIPAEVFSVNSEGEGFFKIEQMNNVKQQADAFAVTIEPEGGSPQPTGDTYLMGNVN